MVDILHRVGVETPSPEKVYEALTTVEGLAGWWTDDTTGDADVGGVIEFRFPPGGFDMEVVDQRPGERVTWKVVDGPEEWVGTTSTGELRQDDDYTIVLFKHAGLEGAGRVHAPLQHEVGTYLLSLKALVETGTGAPAPRDVHIAFPDCRPSRSLR